MGFLLLILFAVIGLVLFLWVIKRKFIPDFTLIEAAAISIIFAVLVLAVSLNSPFSANDMKPPLSENVKTDPFDLAEEQLGSLAAALTMYRFDMMAYPDDQEGLDGLWKNKAQRATWRGPYISTLDILTDPWGRPYHYNLTGGGTGYKLFSLGADNKSGGQDENRDLLKEG